MGGVRTVPADGYGQSQRRQLVENVRKLVDPDINVTIREVDDIERTSAQKYRWIVNEYGRRQVDAMEHATAAERRAAPALAAVC